MIRQKKLRIVIGLWWITQTTFNNVDFIDRT
jgi:hypothetical protein